MRKRRRREKDAGVEREGRREEKKEGPVGVDLGDTGDHQPHNLI